MANRPNPIDLRSQSSMSTYSRPLRSPRLHVAGEAPPELSPLDAFALQSRLLAKQLQESNKSGRRMSRLPPLTDDSPLIVQGRSEYFRSFSQDASEEESETPVSTTGLGLKMEVEHPENRPQSMHPRMSHVPDAGTTSPRPSQEQYRGGRLEQVSEEEGIFGAGPRTGSPEPMDVEGSIIPQPALRDNFLPSQSPIRGSPITSSPVKLNKQGSFDASFSLAPPRSFFPKRSSSVMSQPLESTGEDMMSQSFHSLPPRKMSSGSSAFGSAQASSSAFAGNQQRSPSISSDHSAPLPRPSFNFSRPLSRSGTPCLDTPSRQASSDSQPSFILADDTAHTPISMNSESFSEFGETQQGAPSYIYSKFSLPRGKNLQRTAPLFPDSWDNSTIPPPPRTAVPPAVQAPPSPPTRPASAHGAGYFDRNNLARPSLERSPLGSTAFGAFPQTTPDSSRPSTDTGRRSDDAPRGRALISPNHHDFTRARTPMSTTTTETASTMKPPPSKYSYAPSASEMSTEEHLQKGIELHESGSLNESTYHLRHAARGGNPTGMLLYALACRHGWGMRPSQREGVDWLRRAAECASIEIADDEEQIKEGKKVNVVERKTRKAQFALSIYELGVSHMNGWGIDQDKSLAVRCFEIAGSWGDVDALAEAGFCYAQGIGCKKDLKKSAKFYREAEAKGMSMVGNSWIHKSKYNDDALSKNKARSKSRTRGIFGRSKNNA